MIFGLLWWVSMGAAHIFMVPGFLEHLDALIVTETLDIKEKSTTDTIDTTTEDFVPKANMNKW